MPLFLWFLLLQVVTDPAVLPPPEPAPAAAPGAWWQQIVTLALIPLAGLVGAWASAKVETFRARRAKRLKLEQEHGPQRRKDDERVLALELRLNEEVEKVNERFTVETEKIAGRFDTVEGLQLVHGNRLGVVEAGVAQVTKDVSEVKEYMHDTSHGLRQELNVLGGRLGMVSDRVETMSDRLDDTHANVGAMSKVFD
jgi:hypothetical protein